MKSGSFVRSLGVGILLATAAPLQLLSFNAYANTAPVAALPASIESNVSSLDAAWNSRHEMHAKIVDFLKRKQALPEDYEVLWRLSRLSYYGGFFALPSGSNSEEKMEIFQVGVDSGDKARRAAPARVEGHYWYAVTLGGWGIAKGILNALSSAKPMREALTEAIKIDPKYHYAGPLRVRGRLYNKLPGVISFGDNKLALEDLKKAAHLAPESKLNHIYLAEVQNKLSGKAEALKTLEYAKTLPDVVGVTEEATYRKDISTLESKFR
ncbi:MAG: hypothetical protein EBR09_01290 [Proteobacteria bacterium]|nr:hypothetical protein [Pseudomonadota bacterium]